MHLTAGNVIDDRYEIVCPIASGGFAVVYKAYQKQFDRMIAIKVLDRYAMDDDDAVPRFEREAKAVSALRHRNIVSVYGYGIWQRAPYMVMELVDGQRLEDVITATGKLEPMRAVQLMLQVCDALEEAHKNGIIHRDLKPSNIMVAKSPGGLDVIKIIDFGLAKLLPGYGLPAQKLTETGTALGTCTYMAPEQCTGQPVDARVDVYSAGCILYQCLAGHPPFVAEAQVAVMFMHLNEHHMPPLTANKRDVTASGLNDIVAHALAKEPKERYQTAAELASDLERVIARKPPHIARGSRVTNTPRARRISTAQRMILLVVAAIATLWFAYAYQTRQSQPEIPEQSSLDIFKKVSAFNDNCDRHERMVVAQQALARNEEDHRLDAERLCILHRMITAQLIAESKLKEATKQNALAAECATQLGKKDAETFPEILHWANICGRTGQVEKCESILLSVINAPDSSFAPKYKAQARFDLAIQYTRANRWDDAIKLLQANLYPLADEQLMINSRVNLGTYLAIRKRNDEAMSVLKQAMTMCGSERPNQVVSAYARMLLLNKEYAQAHKLLHEIPQSQMKPGSLAVRNLHTQRLTAAAGLGLRREAEIEFPELLNESLLCDEPLATIMDNKLCHAALTDAGWTDLITRFELYFIRQHRGT